MFAKRKAELELIKKSIESLENTQKSNEMIVSTFCDIIQRNDFDDTKLELQSNRDTERQLIKQSIEGLQASQKNIEMVVNEFCNILKSERENNTGDKISDISEEDKIRAAYALNLCTVSVSQIIDYNDINVLEQEYETILNNLNLENMPKDEALLNILKQILDTVSFFRIQEGDKKFIDKEYQQKMKNAIWSSVPNFGLIVAGGNPFTMIVSLASQIGIGYMNYRKTKAENELERERQEWQLQRAAIEQLNGLRRELFDASWRLADKYSFPDEYRLTERQISQYNDILMDTDSMRRYERLSSISENFNAYPSFWYHFGHAANSVAQKAFSENEFDIYTKYKYLAISNFEKYMQSNNYSLLRENQITSSCALEYIDLLDADNDKDKIKELLNCAIKMSGKQCDILQLCALAQLRIGDKKEATLLLKYLVNENYNAITNAQLLSVLYVCDILENNDKNSEIAYKILKCRIPEELIFPIPNDFASLEQAKREFTEKQQKILYERYVYVLVKYYEKCSIKFNKAIPVPDPNKKYYDSFFSDAHDKREERLNQYKALFSNKTKAEEYFIRCANTNFTSVYLDTLNEMVNDIETLLPDGINKKEELISRLVDSIKLKIEDKKDIINTFQTSFNSKNRSLSFEQVHNLFLDISFITFTAEFMDILDNAIKDHVFELDSMFSFSQEETTLKKFCINHNIPVFRDVINLDELDDYNPQKVYFSSELLGGMAFERAKTLTLAKEMANCVISKIEEIITDSKSKTHFYVKWDNRFVVNYNKYLERKKKYDKNSIYAILCNDVAGGRDLIFTVDGIIFDRTFSKIISNIAYNMVEITDDRKMLKLGNNDYKNNNINIDALYQLIQELSEIAFSRNDNKDTYEEKFITNSNNPMLEDYNGQ